MGRSSRDKGKRGEREVVDLLRPIFPQAKRAMQSRSGSDYTDVEGTPFWVEVKRGKAPSIYAAVQQARAATDGRPILVLTRRDHDSWFATLPWEVLQVLLEKAYGVSSETLA